MKIVDNVMYTAPVPMMVDCNNFIAINGQMFSKDLTPIPLKFMPQMTGSFIDTNAYSICPIACKYTLKKNDYTNYEYENVTRATSNQVKYCSLVDNIDHNTVYTTNSHTYVTDTLYKITVDENCNVSQKYLKFGNGMTINLVGQSDTHLFILSVYHYNHNGYSYYYPSHIYYQVVRKSDFTIVKSNTTILDKKNGSYYVGSYPQFTKLYENNKYIYIHVSGKDYYNSNHSFVIDKTNFNFTMILDELESSSTVGFSSQATSGIYKDGTLTYYYTKSINTSESDGDYAITNEIYQATILESDLSISVKKLDTVMKFTKSYNRLFTLRSVITEINDIKYISYIPCHKCGREAVDDKDKNIITFKILEDGTLEEVSKTPIVNTQIYIDFFSKDRGTHLTIVTENNIDFMSFNSITQRFELKDTMSVNMRDVGIDHQNRLWIRDISNNLDLYNEQLPANIYIKFASDEYSYLGEDINSSILVSSKNFNGDYIESNIRVTLIGSCKFNDGTQVSDIRTIAGDETVVPIIIDGSGPLRVSARLVE